MTQYYQDLLTKLRNPPVAEKKEHHLFLLGTGVDYVDRPTDPTRNTPYIRGETFSYTAQLMTQLLGEQDSLVKNADASQKTSPNYAHPYHSNSVDVINGADTPGFEVGDRLAKALMLALGAIAEGKTNLSISGFSRGGVESIVLTHELERVREALEKDLQKDPSQRRTLAAIISESNSVPGLSIRKDPSYTRQSLNTLVTKGANEDDEILKASLLGNLNKLQVNLFVLDPVPGGNFGKIARIGWQEEAFYTLPSFVVKKQEFVQKHETSNCFKPIIPLGMPYEVLPGCHGTGDGNQFDHNGASVPDTLQTKDLSGVQDLVLRRWMDFTFPEGIPLDNAINFGHTALDAVVNAYLPATQPERNKQLLENYQKIQDNYPAFEWLATRNYTGLGRYMAERQVHFRQRGNTPITDLDVHGDGKTFLNLQHVKLWMADTLEVSDFFGKSLVEQVQWLKNNIEAAFKTGDLSQSVLAQTDMVSRLLEVKSNHPLVKESLSYLVNTVTQTYLRNHLSLEEREQCRNCVVNTFKILADAASGESIKDPVLIELAASLTKIIRTDLTSTMIQHQNSLLSLANKLSSDSKAVMDKQDAEETPMSWLMSAQKLIADLDLLQEQIGGLEQWCDHDMLTDNWKGMLPKFGTNPEDVSYEAYKERLVQYIQQQEMLLVVDASKILSQMPKALENKPKGLERRFYDYIHRLASIDKVNSELQTVTEILEKVNYLNAQLDAGILEIRDAYNKLEQASEEERSSLNKHIQLLTDQLKELDVQLKSAQQQAAEATESLSNSGSSNTILEKQITEFSAEILRLKKQSNETEVQLKSALKQVTEVAESLSHEESSNKKLETQIAELSAEIVKLKEESSEKEVQLQSALQQINDAAESVSSADSSNKELQKQITELSSEIVKLKEQSSEKLVELHSAIESNQLLGKKVGELEHYLQDSDSASKKGYDELVNAREELKGLKSELEVLRLHSVSITDELKNENAALLKADSTIASLTDKARESNEALKAAQEEILQLKRELALKNQVDPVVIIQPPVIDSVTEADNQTMKQQLKAYQSAEERAAILKIDRLVKVTTEYLNHLIKSDDKSPLMEAKMASVYELLGHLNNTKLLPSEQLSAFDNSLKSTQDTIKEHRDPTWMRFFRDCARILTVALSGVGLYRMATGQSPQFFQPSKGENFVEEVSKTSTPTNK
jgi:septal ring factor EnvC (AmiA/AmiB activator)